MASSSRTWQCLALLLALAATRAAARPNSDEYDYRGRHGYEGERHFWEKVSSPAAASGAGLGLHTTSNATARPQRNSRPRILPNMAQSNICHTAQHLQGSLP